MKDQIRIWTQGFAKIRNSELSAGKAIRVEHIDSLFYRWFDGPPSGTKLERFCLCLKSSTTNMLPWRSKYIAVLVVNYPPSVTAFCHATFTSFSCIHWKCCSVILVLSVTKLNLKDLVILLEDCSVLLSPSSFVFVFFFNFIFAHYTVLNFGPRICFNYFTMRFLGYQKKVSMFDSSILQKQIWSYWLKTIDKGLCYPFILFYFFALRFC